MTRQGSTTRVRRVVIRAAWWARLLPAAVVALGLAGPAPEAQAQTTYTFSGAVWSGLVGRREIAVPGVWVSVYGSNNPYPAAADLLGRTLTDSHGAYEVVVPADPSFEFYAVREADPAGATSAGALSAYGVVMDANWIQFAWPLDGRHLGDNEFWDLLPAPPTPTFTPTPTPTRHRPRPSLRRRPRPRLRLRRSRRPRSCRPRPPHGPRRRRPPRSSPHRRAPLHRRRPRPAPPGPPRPRHRHRPGRRAGRPRSKSAPSPTPPSTRRTPR